MYERPFCPVLLFQKEPVIWVKLFVEYVMSFVQFQAKTDTLFCAICIFIEVRVRWKAGIVEMWLDEGIA